MQSFRTASRGARSAFSSSLINSGIPSRRWTLQGECLGAVLLREENVAHHDVLLPASTLHSSAVNGALSKFMMPAMSPTMTEGGIASWKKKAGDTFSAGDVLLEIVRVLSLTTLSHSLI